MPAKWQQWMPFHIDKFNASPWVQAMHPAAQSGYLRLLASQWQTDDCTLPADEEDLAVLSGLGKWNLWQDHSKTITRHFAKLEDGRLRNIVCHREWEIAKKIFDDGQREWTAISEARSKAGKIGNEVRWKSQPDRKSIAKSSQTGRKRVANDRFTETVTTTETEKHKNPSGKPEADTRHSIFHSHIDRYWKHKTGEDKAPWDGSEGKALSALLAAKPDLTLEQFRIALKHRGDSPDEVQTERPRQWLPNILRFSGGPLDRYGKPLTPAPQAPVRRYANEVQHA